MGPSHNFQLYTGCGTSGAYHDGSGTTYAQITVPVDVKIVVDNSSATYYKRLHGVTDWTQMTQVSCPGELADLNSVWLDTVNCSYGNVDSLRLTATVPEPATVTLLVTGLIGLLAYAWRKRK